MSNIMQDADIPNDSGVAIEYKIPRTGKRIDFIITGVDENNRYSAIIIELKQWSEGVHLTNKDGVVATDFYGNREVAHPCYQAWSYCSLIEDYNDDVRNKNILLKPCAYLHNYPDDQIINHPFYQPHIDKAPLFLKHDGSELCNFIKKYIKKSDKGEVLYTFEQGKMKPSKNLIDSLVSMLKNKPEFTLIDSQKVVYETALNLLDIASPKNKQVLIVEGGPGTGKSVLAINLLAEFTRRGFFAQYATRNSAPKEVYKTKLKNSFTKSIIDELFRSTSDYREVDKNSVDGLIIDEAHRLTEKGGFFNNLGENQVKETINASKLTIFFIDEGQRVTIRDIGTKGIIEYYAKKFNANVHHLKLESQFRCNGSDGYLAWLADVLQIQDTAHDTLEGINFDFRVIDSPQELHDLIIKQNQVNNKSRVVAGYCWNWVSAKNLNLKDIVIGNYSAVWNLKADGQAYIIKEHSVHQIGCIHTCQGLELDYVGVIIGPDLIVRNGRVVTDASKRAKTDQSLKGLKKYNSEDQKIIADELIKNTYRTLMTRGMKGCYIYCTDPETQQYFKDNLAKITNQDSSN